MKYFSTFILLFVLSLFIACSQKETHTIKQRTSFEKNNEKEAFIQLNNEINKLK